ncbi:hypothetical protein OGAPHI_005718 [Ogataea philodendri]|uniref:Uncharacterized protein n=1 Tax=Ogataea philodendri TaxID=1378263 RepID=A0A9P8T290_9ASCO|nr:uncharacterized protein OGAPHI_005718 [Ogataea philodendri]KAH3662466.1 hypothetical protein OGAPHI_005718 [Ogataea philodendri]
MVSLLRCSMFKPSPGSPMIASEYWSISRMLMISSTLDPTVNVIQNSLWLLSNLDIVGDVSPVENTFTLKDTARFFRRTSLVFQEFGLLVARSGLDILLGNSLLLALSKVVQEKHNVSLLQSTLGVLNHVEIDKQEENHKSHVDTPVSPLVLSIVVVRQANKVGSGNRRSAWNSSNGVADLVGHGNSGIVWNVIVAIEMSSVELVSHQSLERVSDWIQIVDPTRPSVHVLDRDSKTCVQNQTTNHKHGWCHGLRKSPETRSKRSHHMRQHKSTGEVHQQVEEERTRISAEVDHEIENQVEACTDQHLIRSLNDNGSESIC